MYVRIFSVLVAAAALTSACDDDYNDPVRPGGEDLRRAPDRPPIEGPAYGDRVPDFDNKNADDDVDDVDRRATPDNDNTALNQRDKNGNTLTPVDQNENASDLEITANVRKQILAAENLSTNADNVKIITKNGVVTLRGVVDSQDEKGWVEGIAKGIPGVQRVDNQLELNLQ